MQNTLFSKYVTGDFSVVLFANFTIVFVATPDLCVKLMGYLRLITLLFKSMYPIIFWKCFLWI